MHTTIPALHVGHGIHQAGLTLFPVWVEAPRIGSLDWAPASLSVTEVADSSGGPRLDTLHARNTSDRKLVSLEGDLLEGGWQNRMIGRSVVLRPSETRYIETLCVEQGRWGGGLEHGSAGRRGSLSVRFGRAQPQADRQSDVWRRIHSVESRLGASATSSFTHQLDRQQVSAPRLIDGQRGVIIGVGGLILGLEMFCSGTGLRSRWAGIVAAAAVDARLGSPEPTRSEKARDFARSLHGRRLHGGEGIGVRPTEGGETRATSWFELSRNTDQTVMTGLGARLAGGANDRGILHLTALNAGHPVLANR